MVGRRQYGAHVFVGDDGACVLGTRATFYRWKCFNSTEKSRWGLTISRMIFANMMLGDMYCNFRIGSWTVYYVLAIKFAYFIRNQALFSAHCFYGKSPIPDKFKKLKINTKICFLYWILAFSQLVDFFYFDTSYNTPLYLLCLMRRWSHTFCSVQCTWKNYWKWYA